MSSKYYYITTPIYYVNDVPHIGHAYTSIACDVIARFMRLAGKNVMFLTGTDEHGQKVEKSAEKFGMKPQEFTDKNSEIFRKMMHQLNISNDDFIRTTENRHKKAVEHFWQELVDKDEIYLDKYDGWYSVRDEAFYSEDELTADGLAPTGAPVEWVEEPSYFFKLSKWQDKLLEFYHNNPDFIYPESRKNEVISFVKSGLVDLSVSRTSFGWGIKVPGDEKHVIYVWLDALTNYISALGYPGNSEKYSNFWPTATHVVGKDILRFHAVYWPAFLMAAGLPLPKSIVAHGWWTNEGQKISKSVGNVIDPFKLIDEFGLDQVRYFLMREVTFGNDGNFSKDNLVARINSELSNKIGNLMQRTCSLVYKYCNKQVPKVSKEFIAKIYLESELINLAINLGHQNNDLMHSFQINKVLDNIINIAEQANGFIDKEAPWALKSDQEKMNEVLYILLEVIRHLGIMLLPFVPDSASKMLDQLNILEDSRSFSDLSPNSALIPESMINQPTPIFPRLENDIS
ncbi:MAG: methionine--tRNA ligase [Rickettsiales bacterium]|nr:methionine--tRNA ligase [Rickettsiales bacterium]MCA0254670.1 methionine--tRNA ligase [Pseudomonadota bacterium]